MADRFGSLDGWTIFSTERYGFNKDEVGEYLAEIHLKYEKLYKEYLKLKNQSK